MQKLILFVGLTKKGRMHDINILRQDFPKEQDWFKSFKILIDLGYLGFAKDYSTVEILIPHKRPSRKGKNLPEKIELTDEQKAHNKMVSQSRIFVEHAIGGIKRFNCLSHRLRNRSENFRHDAILIGAGIWNLSLSQIK